ncbi:MAG: mucoidy inhibitor MuiA family protein [Spirochaetales bacterium]|nr:mucoidy inhibitor MuiA family protein [Spirochaetales bacterium]
MNTIEMSFPVREVTVYPAGARITRAETVAFAKGENSLVIRKLPEAINEDSVRIETADNRGITIVGIHSEDAIRERYDENRYRKERAILDELILEQKRCEAVFNNYTDEFLLFMDKGTLIKGAGEEVKRSIIVENWKEFYGFMRKKLFTNREETRKVIFEWLTLQEKREAAEKNIGALLSYDRIREHGIVAVFDAKTDVDCEVRVMYLQPGVSWYPAYTIRADINKKQLEIGLFGMISQTTGEDWENVEVLLSTAVPLQQCRVPDVTSKRIREQDTGIITVPASPEAAVMGKTAKMEDEMDVTDMDKEDIPEEKVTEKKKRVFPSGIKRKSGRIAAASRGFSSMEDVDGLIDVEKTTGISGDATPPAMNTQALHAKRLSQEQKGRGVSGAAEIEEIVASVDGRLGGRLKIDTLSPYYRDLYAYLSDTYTPEGVVEVSGGIAVNRYFARGVSPLESVGGFDYRYHCGSTKNTIPSSRVPFQIGVDTAGIPMNMVYVTVPLEKEAVFLKAVFTNTYGNPFPKGPAQVFVENSFLGAIMFPTLGMNEGTSISLGVERDIKVLRKETSERKTGGFVKKGMAVDFSVEIELISYKETDVVCEVYDRIPISERPQEIAVVNEKYDPKPQKISDRNIVFWKTTLEPKKKKVFTVTYTVRHPEDYRLTVRKADHPYLEP